MERYIQKGHVRAVEQRRVLTALKQLAVSIGRCQETIASLMAELNSVNTKYQGPRSTRDEIEYLTILLSCAKKKLAWEKQISSLRKRAPELLENMSRVLNDKEYPPTDELKADMLQSLQIVQQAMTQLQGLPEVAEE